VGVAALEYTLVVVDRSREGSFAMAEQLGFDQCLGKLRQVDRYEAFREVGGESALGS